MNRGFSFVTIALVIAALSWIWQAAAEEHRKRCEEILAPPAALEEHVSVRNEDQKSWTRIHGDLQERLKGQSNPLSEAGLDAILIGGAHAKLASAFQDYHLYHQWAAAKKVLFDDYLRLRTDALHSIESVLRDRTPSLNKLFAALEVTRLMSMIHGKVEFPPAVEQAAQEAKENGDQGKGSGNKNQDRNQDEQGEQGENGPRPPEWGEHDEIYQPENKKRQSSGNSAPGAAMVSTTVDVPKRLLRERIYDAVAVDGSWRTVPLMRPRALGPPDGPVLGHSRLLVTNEKRFLIPIQYGKEHGVVPDVGSFDGFRIDEVYPGEFRVTIESEGLKEIEVPLRTAPELAFIDGASEQDYSRHSGIPEDQWPVALREFLTSLKGRNLSRRQIAEEVEGYFTKSGPFDEYVEGEKFDEAGLNALDETLKRLLKKYSKPVALAHLGVFNCDGAATVATVILRDFFAIPARPVAGRTISGSRVIDGKLHHVSDSNRVRHAWVEVWIEKDWEPFEMTPQNEQSRGQNSPQKGQPPPQPGQQSEQQSEQQPDVSSLIDELSREAGGQAGQQAAVMPPTSILNALFRAAATHLNEQLLTSSSRKSVLDRAENNWLQGKEFHLFVEPLRAALNVNLKLFLNHLTGLPELSLGELVGSAQRKLLARDVTGAYADLFSVRAAAKALAAHRNLNAAEVGLVAKIDSVVAQMQAMNHPDAKAFELVNRLVTMLPGRLSRLWLERKFGQDLAKLGSMNLSHCAAAVKSGSLRTLMLAGHMKEFVELVLNPDRVPGIDTQKTSMRAAVQTKHDDIVLARSPLEFPRFILNPRPGEGPFDALMERRQLALGEREVITIPHSKHAIKRRLTVAYYDVSGSMDGDRMKAVDAALLAFVDAELSEVDAFNRPVNEVIIIPFNSDVIENRMIHIQTRQQALDFIENKIALPTKADGSTDIEKVLVHFYTLVARAHQRSLQKNSDGIIRSLKRANLALFTDGGSNVDEKNVAEARAQVPDEVQLNMNLISVGFENQVLKKLAEESVSQRAKPMHRTLSDEEIKNKIQAVESDMAESPDAFAADQDPPPRLVTEIMELGREVPAFIRSPNEGRVWELRRKLNFSQSAAGGIKDADAVIALKTLSFQIGQLDLPRNVRIDFMERLLTAYPQLMGRELEALTLSERNALEKLASWALDR